MKINRRHLLTAASLVATALAVGASGSRAETSPAEIWADLAKDVFKGRTLEDGTGLVALDAPYRAEDAALVPVTISLILSDAGFQKYMSVRILFPATLTFRMSLHAEMKTIRHRHVVIAKGKMTEELPFIWCYASSYKLFIEVCVNIPTRFVFFPPLKKLFEFLVVLSVCGYFFVRVFHDLMDN